MKQLLIVYYSRTGNTEKMAKAIMEGAKNVEDVEVNLMIDFEATPEKLVEAEGIIIGTPTYHHDTTRSFKNLFEECAVKGVVLKDKIGAVFGSYGWSGEAPRLIMEMMENKFEMRVIKPPLLIKYSPDDKGLEECQRLGKKVAEKTADDNKKEE
jgi:flavorubredoxin